MLKPRMLVPVMLWIIFHCYFFGANASIFYGSGDYDNTEEQMNSKKDLVFAHVIYRHGDRTPIYPYRTDPWRMVWPDGYGQLTNRGKQQQFELGKWLKKRYISLLGRKYDSEKIYVRATDVDRTLMSAQVNLAGMYRPNSEDNWSDCLNWEPIPVHSSEVYNDIILGFPQCPVYRQLSGDFLDSKVFQDIQNKYESFYEYLAKNSGETVGEPHDVQFINNTLYIESLYNKTLPEWTKKVFGGPDMTYLSNWAFSQPTYTREMARLKTGPLIKEMLQRFKEKLAGGLVPDRSVWIYSGHDTTIANVLNTLKLFDLHSPPYAACILVEMRVNSYKTPFVSIFYKNTTDEPTAMEIPGCGTECPLETMFDLYKDILPIDWDEECKFEKDRRTTEMPWNKRHKKLLTTYSVTEKAVNGKQRETGKSALLRSPYIEEAAKLGFLIGVIAFLAYGVVTYYRKPNWKEYFRLP